VSTVQVLLEPNCVPVKLAVIVVPAITPMPFNTAPVIMPLPFGVLVTVNVVPLIVPVKLVLVLPNVNAFQDALLSVRGVQLMPSGLVAPAPAPVTLVQAPPALLEIVVIGVSVGLVLTCI